MESFKEPLVVIFTIGIFSFVYSAVGITEAPSTLNRFKISDFQELFRKMS